jgi:hypothetical protein
MKRCGSSCPPIIGGKECREKVQCGCEVCSSLEAIDLSLAESCYKACNAIGNGRPKNTEEYLCSIGGAELWSRYHIVRCGYNPDESIEAGQQKKAQDEINRQNKPLSSVFYILIILIVAATLFLIYKKNRK